MARLAFSTAIGVLGGIAFAFFRGGWHDMSFVVPAFAIGVFTMTFAALLLIHHESSITRHLQSNNARLARDAIATLIVASAFYWTGALIQRAGLAGWIVLTIFSISLPLTVCLIASRAAVFFGVTAATAVTVSYMIHHSFFQSPDWLSLLRRDAMLWAIFWGILVVLSLVVSVPLTVQRGRVTKTCTGVADPGGN